MTKQDFEAIAAVFAGDYASCANDGERRKVVGLALSLSDVFKRTNPRFDRVRFLKACGLNKSDAPLSLSEESL